MVADAIYTRKRSGNGHRVGAALHFGSADGYSLSPHVVCDLEADENPFVDSATIEVSTRGRILTS